MPEEPKAPLITQGLALDANGDVWRYGPYGNLEKIASKGGGGNGGGPVTVTLGDPVTIAVGNAIPSGFYLAKGYSVNYYNDPIFGPGQPGSIGLGQLGWIPEGSTAANDVEAVPVTISGGGGGANGDFLPLAGGTITGDLEVLGGISCPRIFPAEIIFPQGMHYNITSYGPPQEYQLVISAGYGDYPNIFSVKPDTVVINDNQGNFIDVVAKLKDLESRITALE